MYPKFDKLTFTEPTKFNGRFDFKMTEVYASLNNDYPKLVGIDPGRNYGITIIEGDLMRVIWGQMPKADQYDYAKLAFLLSYKLPAWGISPGAVNLTVEGPAFGAKKGKIHLLHGIRIGFYIGACQAGYESKIVAPMTARKQVLGHGHTQAADLMPQINPNAADSVALAFCGLEPS